MRELLRDPDAMTRIVRRRVLRAMVPALGKLDRVARGREIFDNDHQRFACVALGRLATVVLTAREDPASTKALDRPEWNTPEKILQLERLYWRHTRTPEEAQQFSAEVEARYAVYESTLPDFGKMGCEAISEYVRTHGPIKCKGDFEDECFPEHLRMATLKKGDDHE